MEIKISYNDIAIPMYHNVLDDILDHKHKTYVGAGGRGSTKSSLFGGIAIPLLIVNYPGTNAICFRKVANTIQDSIYSQIVWGIDKLGLMDYFKIPKTYANPIIFKPTGQAIYFKGLDDPNKPKSIKPKTGYFAITWFEELDQYAGENELRKVTQSTRRGGNLYWDFRTFNPPISQNNWANEYADRVERSNNTLVVRNTYLDVPRDWLGDDFFDEADELKEINYEAYKHEYLGIPVGTGGSVFANAEDLDMEQQVETWSANGKNPPMWKTFENIYNGLDWGFGVDPFRFVKMHFDRTRLDLYIFAEFNCKKLRNEETFHILYDEKKLVSRNELVIADSAEPKSIADFKSYGALIKGVDKYGGSVRDGIGWLQTLRHIYIDKRRCPLTWQEFTEYEYEQDKNGEFYSAFPDANNHSIDAVRYGLSKWWKKKGH